MQACFSCLGGLVLTLVASRHSLSSAAVSRAKHSSKVPPRSGVQFAGACCWFSVPPAFALQDGQHRGHAQTNEICLFLETPGTSRPLPDLAFGYITLFFKLYDPTQLKLSFVGHLQVGLVDMLVLASFQADGSPGAAPSSASCHTGGRPEGERGGWLDYALTGFT